MTETEGIRRLENIKRMKGGKRSQHISIAKYSYKYDYHNGFKVEQTKQF